MTSRGAALTLTLLACALAALPARATEPPPPGMLDRMRREGTYPKALDFARRLGNHELKQPRRGAGPAETDPALLAELISQHLGESLAATGAKAVSAASQAELDWTRLDLNHDRVVDERDLLALGYPQPKATASFPTLGTVKTFALLIDFSDYPHYFERDEVQETLFGNGNDAFGYRGLHSYYEQASFGQLNMQGNVYGWHRASRPRTWYHPDDSLGYPEQGQRQVEMVEEAILAADAAGEDFSQYDNDGDGNIDYFLVLYAGPHGDWSTYWWGYFGVGLPYDFVLDGVHFTTYSWQWERSYYFGEEPPTPAAWDPLVTIHETGHALGLPDYYDYDGTVGPPGGAGGLDIMDGTWGGHCAFSKYVFGWIAPTIAFGNLDDQPLAAAALHPDAVLTMPGFDPVSPWQEYFITENRSRFGLDAGYPTDGLVTWHVDARVNETGGGLYDNSYTDHKLLALVQADGLGEIEAGLAGANAGDYYNAGESLSDTSNPDSRRYAGTPTNITMDDISADGEAMTADFTLYTSTPPQVTINAPTGGSEISGMQTIDVAASDDGGLTRVQLLIDGLPVYETTNASFSYSWNSRVEFNRPLSITARAWDAESQSGTAVVGVTVNNAGVTSYSDTFNGAPYPLVNWRAEHFADQRRGQQTAWSTRPSPPDPARSGSGNEAWVAPATYDDTTYGAYDGLRSSRIDATGFTRPIQLRFNYRNRGGLSLWATTDEGASYTMLESALPYADGWAEFNRTYSFNGRHVYFRLLYTGDVSGNTGNGLGASIADFSLRQSPSSPPTVSFTSPADGSVLSGDLSFDAAAADDGNVASVKFYIFGGEVATDTSAPWNYTRSTVDDDNDPALDVQAIAFDDDGLPSLPAKLKVALRNPKAWPASEDFEAGLPNWYLQEDGSAQEWGLAPGQGRGGSAALTYTATAGWNMYTSEGAWFFGSPIPAGRQSVDLSDPLCLTPALSYWFNGNLPTGQGVNVYFFSTWHGFQWAGASSGQAADWTQSTISLVPFRGQSGRVVFWIFGNDQTDGTGAYWDDISISNTTPVLDGVFPNTGYPGQPVLVSGNYFGEAQGVGSVSFGGKPCAAADYISWTSNSIYVRVPDGAQDGDVVVTVDGLPSNGLPFTVSPLAISFSGIDPQHLYKATDPAVPLAVTVSTGIDRVEVWADGVKYGESSSAPGFADLVLDMAKVPNGHRSAIVQGYSANSMVASAPAPFMVYSLRGDINGDGVIGPGDTEELKLHLGAKRFKPGYEYWYDPNNDFLVSEADASYIGYYWGTANPAP
jgi:M6 family metalloprotease-like protein